MTARSTHRSWVLWTFLLLGGMQGGLATGSCDLPALPRQEEPEKPAAPPADRIAQATGLRFSVLESLIRRSITSTRMRYGFKIRAVREGSPAARAGLRRGDILLKWKGKPIRSLKSLGAWIESAEPGERIEVTFARRKKKAFFPSRKPWRIDRARIRLAAGK